MSAYFISVFTFAFENMLLANYESLPLLEANGSKDRWYVSNKVPVGRRGRHRRMVKSMVSAVTSAVRSGTARQYLAAIVGEYCTFIEFVLISHRL